MNRLHATKFHVLCVLNNKNEFKRRELPRRGFANERPPSEGGMWERFLKSLKVNVGVDVKSQ